MDKATALEHSVQAFLASVSGDLQNPSRTASEDAKLRDDCAVLFAQWKTLQETLEHNMDRLQRKSLPNEMRDFFMLYTSSTDDYDDDDDDAAASNLEDCIREHAKAIGLALRPTGQHEDLRADLPFECRKLFAMYASFKATADPAKHDFLGIAETMVELFELYVQYLPSINKQTD
jgi:hypothetical protein